jgi:hypothetical protein
MAVTSDAQTLPCGPVVEGNRCAFSCLLSEWLALDAQT